ncbi:MAG: hypothetical protein RR048_00215 [Oscillospiraceae bacterium]
MSKIRRSITLDEKLYKDISAIADDTGADINFVIETALKHFRDNNYLENKSCSINEGILNMVEAMCAVLERKINNKTNSCLSELAIQSFITNMIVAKGLDISEDELNIYRIKAINFIKQNNRIFRLSEIID